MKIKKALALILSGSLCIATLTGCSQTTTSYVDEISKTSKWSGSNSEVKGNIKVEAEGQNLNLSFVGTGYSSGNKGMAEVKFNDPSGLIKIPEIKVYVDGTTTYINKGYFTGIFAMTGQAVPEKLASINAEYIGIESSMDIAKIQGLATNPDAMIEFAKNIFGNTDIDLPLTKNGREYSMNLDSNGMVDLGVKALKSAANNMEKINTNFGLGMTAEEIAQFRAGINSADIDSQIQVLKTMIDGSSLKIKDVFGDDTYTQDINLTLKIKDSVKATIEVNSKAVKAEAKEITMPTSVVKLTQAQYLELFGASTEVNTTTTTGNSNVKFIPAA